MPAFVISPGVKDKLGVSLQATAPRYFFERNSPAASREYCVQCLLCEVDVFQIIQMSEDGFAGVGSLGASGSLGEAVEAFFDGFGKANG